MEKKELKKIPIVTYLLYLLVVSALLAGVTFARYSTFTSGDVSTDIAGFRCSYSINDMSSNTFSNADYWLRPDDGSAPTPLNTARTVRYTLSNSREGIVSEVDLQAAIRLYAPAEFVDSLAVQLAYLDGTTPVPVTPQYVLSDLIYDGTAYRDWDTSGSFDTGNSEPYEDLDYGERTLTMSGGITDTDGKLSGSVSGVYTDNVNPAHDGVVNDKNTTITISASTTTARYSVGFQRNERMASQVEEVGYIMGENAPMLYLDLQKDVPYYTVDMSTPEMFFEAGNDTSRVFVLYVTVAKRIASEDLSLEWGAEKIGNDSYSADYWSSLLQAPASSTDNKYYNGALVTGYHFEREADVYDENGSVVGHTTVRINKIYDYDNGGYTLEFEHVAPLSEGSDSATIAHPINEFYTDTTGTAYNDTILTMETVQDLYGKCSNGGKSGYMSLNGFTDDPFVENYGETAAFYMLSQSLSKGYSTKLNALFVQASESEVSDHA